MTYNIGPKSQRRPSVKIAAGLAISALLVLGTSALPAQADDRHDDHGRNDRGHDNRGHDDRGHDRGGNGWTGGYYRAPPVIYGSPYYAPPPVIYGPAVGISLPGINIGIR
ncbi:MAG TPA: hypothetical protein VM689_25510 [Aliidongia sp.]|nr:hypothetical protein [Aliidongia sp.]